MAKTITPLDCYALINLMTAEARGLDQTIQAVDGSTFISAGENLLNTGRENILNTLSIVLGKTLIAVRPYSAKMNIVQAVNGDLYTDRLRKISYYDDEAIASGAFNTQLFTNIAQGYDGDSDNSGASVGGQWEQKLSYVMEFNFATRCVWDYLITIPLKQLQIAFTSEAEFSKFIGGILTNHANIIEKGKEAWNRAAVLNKIAATYVMDSSMPGSVVDLTTEFNSANNTNYTSEQLRNQYIKEFTAFMVERIKLDTEKMQEYTALYHWTPAKNDASGNPLCLSRHTPAGKMKAMIYEPLMLKARCQVFPDIFNPQYLNIDTQYEKVLYWQNFNDPSAIKFKPAIPNVSDPSEQTAPKDPVEIPYVVGLIFDEDALVTSFDFEGAYSTNVHPRKLFQNTFLHFAKGCICDQTENTILYVMTDNDVEPDEDEPVEP